MRILLTKGTPSAPKSQSQVVHIHKSLDKSCLCSLEPARGTQKHKDKDRKWRERERCKEKKVKNRTFKIMSLFVTVHSLWLNVFMFILVKTTVLPVGARTWHLH